MTIARVITAPQALANEDRWPMVYLGGTIDMGDSEDWQARAVELLAWERALILNPRRLDWVADRRRSPMSHISGSRSSGNSRPSCDAFAK